MTVDDGIKEVEMEAIEALQKRMKGTMSEELFNDVYLFRRFLRARDFNLDNAEIMLRKHLEWRKKHDLENIMKFKKSEVMEKYVSNSIIAFDKEDCLVRYCPVGSLDFIGLINSSSPEEITKFLLYEMETETVKLKEQSEKLGKNIDRCSYAYDMQNFSFAQGTDKRVIHVMLQLLNFYVHNYPERLKSALLYNVPVYFNFIFAVFRPLLPNSVINKIKFYSDDSYKKDLIELVDADKLPKFLGGNLTDPDGNPLCHTLVKHLKGRVPESYYIRKTKRSLSKLPGVKKVTLARAAFHEVNLEVKEPGSYLEWEFETKCRDIGFGLFYQEKVGDEENITELVPIQRIDTEEHAETGTFKCENPGTHVILFDNTYSWVRAKEIYFRAKVVTPKEHEAEMAE